MGIGLNLIGMKVNDGDKIFYVRKFARAPGPRFRADGWTGCLSRLDAL